MKKFLVLGLCLICILSMTACGKGQKAQELYNAIGSISFSDESILTNDELSKLQTMRDQREQYLKDKDIDGLTALQEEWASFRQPIDSYIKQYQSACGTFFKEADKALLTNDELQTCQSMEASISEAYQGRDSNALSQAISEWDSFSNNLREVINTYNDIDQSPFAGSADKDLLSSETLTKMAELSAATESALVDRDAAALKTLKSEWNTFTNNAKSEIEAAKEKLLNYRASDEYVLETYTYESDAGGGYTYTATLKIGPWVKYSDTEAINDIWESIGGTGSIPFDSFTYNNWSSAIHFGKGTSIMAFGTIAIEDTTQGGFSLADTSRGISIDIYSYELDDATLVDSYMQFSNGGSYLHSVEVRGWRILHVYPKMVRRTWGPVPFVICANEAISPEYPDGRPDVINATWSFGDNEFNVSMWVQE